MTTPSILYKNMVDVASRGLIGAGEILASGSAASVDKANRQFDLSSITVAADLTEADDFVKGATLFFTATGRTYTIEDYTASTDIVTVKETPNESDTGAYFILKKLYSPDFDTDFPLSRIADGTLTKKWKDAAAANTAEIYAFAPNGILDGGFEYGAAGIWTLNTPGGSGICEIASSGEIIGSYSLRMQDDTGTSPEARQIGVINLKAGKTYALIFRAYVSSGASTGTGNNLQIRLEYTVAGGLTDIPVTWTPTDGADNQSAGVWYPNSIAGTTPTDSIYKQATFTVPEDIDAGDWVLVINDNYTSAPIFFDCVYLWELIRPDTFIMAGHNAFGNFQTGSALKGLRCDDAWSKFGTYTEDDEETLIDLYNDVDVHGAAPIYETFDQTENLYPIMKLELTFITGKIWEAGEIWIGERWDWTVYPNRPITGRPISIEALSRKARGGPKKSTTLYSQRRAQSDVELIDGDEAIMWEDFIKECGGGSPFWLRIQTSAALGITAHTKLMSCVSSPEIEPDTPTFFRAKIDIEEAF